MPARPGSIETYLRRVAVGTALWIILFPPLGYYFLESSHRLGSIDVEARSKAEIVNAYIARNPGTWQYQHERLAEVIKIAILPHSRTRLIDLSGNLLAEAGESHSGQLQVRRAPVFDYGKVCGHIEIADDLDEAMRTSIVIAFVSTLLGLLAYVVLSRRPLQALRQSQDDRNAELRRRLEAERELRRANEQLADANRIESVGRLAAGVAHEVKNPLAIVRFGVDYLSRQLSSDPNQEEVLADVRDAVGRADTIVNGLLDFARNKSLARVPLDINAVIDDALGLVRHDLELHQIAIALRQEKPLPALTGDRNRLMQVFINLLTNAIQAIGQSGKIIISTRTVTLGAADLQRDAIDNFKIGDQVIVVEIQDSGPGLATDVMPRLFDPFFTTKPVGEGTGLGLSIVRNIMRVHDGDAILRNHPEGGASAILTFRLEKEER